jgi:hypothetical protein
VYPLDAVFDTPEEVPEDVSRPHFVHRAPSSVNKISRLIHRGL